MDYIEKLFSRLNLQHIREFLLYGTEAVKITEQSYRERLDTSQQPVFEIIQKAYPGELESPEVDLFLSGPIRCAGGLSGNRNTRRRYPDRSAFRQRIKLSFFPIEQLKLRRQ
ncbi:hypothetical protein [Anaeromassilibacillus senegalensis]|uniref:hypothetical protein n=1 Tax=Anaeromassilibacillus senegalensis TaxID=1673717 RepID=UPI0012B62DE6|nr:hypothetical protein [Anaeromassilibacillus senegalensis]